MKQKYPHTIENGGGEELTFLRFIENEECGILEIENKIHPGAGPPMHVHFLQDESLTVIEGKAGAMVYGKTATLHGPGETMTFNRGVAHRFWNAGDTILICRGQVSPANNLEYFLSEIFRSTKQNGGKRPSAFDGAFLQTKYKTEFDLVEIPSLVKKVMFPIAFGLGMLTGKHRKFSNAPEPLKKVST